MKFILTILIGSVLLNLTVYSCPTTAKEKTDLKIAHLDSIAQIKESKY